MGDRLLKVNDEDVTKMTHQDAVLTLLKPTEEITLTVQHDPLPDNFQVIIKNLNYYFLLYYTNIIMTNLNNHYNQIVLLICPLISGIP